MHRHACLRNGMGILRPFVLSTIRRISYRIQSVVEGVVYAVATVALYSGVQSQCQGDPNHIRLLNSKNEDNANIDVTLSDPSRFPKHPIHPLRPWGTQQRRSPNGTAPSLKEPANLLIPFPTSHQSHSCVQQNWAQARRLLSPPFHSLYLHRDARTY